MAVFKPPKPVLWDLDYLKNVAGADLDDIHLAPQAPLVATLELNVKAKKADAFMQLKSVAELEQAIFDGRYIEYQSNIGRVSFNPTLKKSADQLQSMIINGAWVHDSRKIRLFTIVRRMHSVTGEVIINSWSGSSVHHFNEYKAAIHFLDILLPLLHFEYEAHQIVKV